MLYPITTSGSTSSTKSRQLVSSSSSVSCEITCDPTICAQVSRVKTFRIKDCDSPIQDIGVGLRREGTSDATLSGHHIRDLDHRVLLWFRKYTFSSSALNVEAENS